MRSVAERGQPVSFEDQIGREVAILRERKLDNESIFGFFISTRDSGKPSRQSPSSAVEWLRTLIPALKGVGFTAEELEPLVYDYMYSVHESYREQRREPRAGAAEAVARLKEERML